MFFENYRRNRRRRLVQEAAARNGLGHIEPQSQTSVFEDNVMTVGEEATPATPVSPVDEMINRNIGNNGSPGETTTLNTWRQRRGGPDASSNAEPQRNSVTNENVVMSNEEARIYRTQNSFFGRMKLSILKYLLLMVRIYKGLFRDVQQKFHRHATLWTVLWTSLTVIVLGIAFFSVIGWIVNVFIQWGFGSAAEFRSMLISLAILHTPLFNKQYYLSRV